MNRASESAAEPVAPQPFERAAPGGLPPESSVEPAVSRPSERSRPADSPQSPATGDREETLAALRQQAEMLRRQTEQIQRKMRQLEQRGNGKAVARVDVEECAGCGSCVDACPQEAIELRDGVAVVDECGCDGCGVCVDECPNEAIALV